MFSPKDAVKAAGMQKQKPTFDRWLQANIARPTVPSQGRGYQAQWNGHALVALLLTKRLGKVGMDLKTAADIAEKITTAYKGSFLEMPASVDIDLDTLEYKTTPLEEWGMNREIVLTINIGSIQQTVCSRLGIEYTDLY